MDLTEALDVAITALDACAEANAIERDVVTATSESVYLDGLAMRQRCAADALRDHRRALRQALGR